MPVAVEISDHDSDRECSDVITGRSLKCAVAVSQQHAEIALAAGRVEIRRHQIGPAVAVEIGRRDGRVKAGVELDLRLKCAVSDAHKDRSSACGPLAGHSLVGTVVGHRHVELAVVVEIDRNQHIGRVTNGGLMRGLKRAVPQTEADRHDPVARHQAARRGKPDSAVAGKVARHQHLRLTADDDQLSQAEGAVARSQRNATCGSSEFANARSRRPS